MENTQPQTGAPVQAAAPLQNPVPAQAQTQPFQAANPPSSTGARPWYGTLLGVVNFIGAALSVLFVIAAIVMMTGGMAPGFAGGLGVLFASFGVILLIGGIIGVVPAFFLGRGYMKGQKWAVIVSLILWVLTLLGGLYQLAYIQIVLHALLVWAAVACLRHPYYNR